MSKQVIIQPSQILPIPLIHEGIKSDRLHQFDNLNKPSSPVSIPNHQSTKLEKQNQASLRRNSQVIALANKVPNTPSKQNNNDSSDEGDASGAIEVVSGEKKIKAELKDDRGSNLYTQDVYLVKKPQNLETVIESISQKFIKEEINFQESIVFQANKSNDKIQVDEFKLKDHLRNSQNLKNTQQKNSKQNKNATNQEQQCYLEIFQKKWEKTELKISRTKINLGGIVIDLAKILKIKIFSSEICEQSQEQIKKFSFDQNENKKKNQQPIKDQNTKISFLKKKIIQIQPSKEPVSSESEEQMPSQNNIIKISKKNLLKLSIQQNHIYQFFQKYSTLFVNSPRQSYSTPLQSQMNGLTSRLPAPFLSFSRIILKKLKQLHPNIKSTVWQAPDFAFRAKIHSNGQFSNGILKGKTCKNFAHIHGNIYKKSQIKGKWERRYIIINQKGLFSYKDEKDEGYSFCIESKSIKYMWTWFNVLKIDQQVEKAMYQISGKQPAIQETKQLSERKFGQEQDKNIMTKFIKSVDPFTSFNSQIAAQNNHTQQIQNSLNVNTSQNLAEKNENRNFYLIIKLKHGFNGQTQFAIPICGFDNEANKSRNWLLAFYKAISQYESQ